MIWSFGLFLTNKMRNLNRIRDITHQSNNATLNTLIMIWELHVIIIESANTPPITINNNISLTIFLGKIPMNATINNGLHSEIMKNPDSLLTKLLEIILLNSKTNLQTIRLSSVCRMNKIQRRHTRIINSSNISILLTIEIRGCGKTLSISKRTLRP